MKYQHHLHDGPALKNLARLNEAKTRIISCSKGRARRKYNFQNHLYKNAFQAMLCNPNEYQFW